jgi:hypothetical protein
MVAQVNHEMFADALCTPRPDPSDSEGVVMALETARALEAQGELRDAARWIRRAAEEAEKDGRDERVLVLARTAADLTNAVTALPESHVAPSSVPTLNVRGRGSMGVPRPEPATPVRTESPPPPPVASTAGTIPPLLAALISSIPPFSTRSSASPAAPATPPPAMNPPTDSSASPPSPPAEKHLTERRMRIGAVRVAVKGSIYDAKSFSVERLEPGQRSPAGSMEAMLVLTGEIDGSLDIATHLRITDSSTPKP